MAALFWVGGSVAYDGVTNTLATTSGGAASVAVITSADTVTFDTNSPAAAAVTTSAAITCTTMTLTTGFTGSLTMSNPLTVSGTITLTQGILNTNGQTCTWGAFASNNANSRALTLGSSAITLTGTGNVWNAGGTIGSLIVAANTATITSTGAATTIALSTKNWNGMSVAFTGSGQSTLAGGVGATIANFTRTGTAAKTDGIDFQIDTTFTGTVTLNSNSNSNRLFVKSNTIGTSRTLTAASVVVTNVVDFMDITGAGAATWTPAGTGGTLGDCGGNSGITFTASATQTWTFVTASTTAFWSTAGNWSGRVPLPQDDVLLGAAFGASVTVSCDMPRLAKSIDWTGATGSPTWSFSSVNTTWFGSLTLIAGMTMTGTNATNFGGRGSYTLTTAGVTITPALTINAPGGTLTLQDSFTSNRATTGALAIAVGALADNGNSVTLTASVGTFTMAAGSTTLTASGAWSIGMSVTGTFWSVLGGTVTHTGSITLTSTSASIRTFVGGGKTYGALNYTVANSGGTLDVTGGNTFNTINFSDSVSARNIRFTAGTTTTVTNWNVNGFSAHLAGVFSITTGTPFTINKIGTPISSDYLNVSDSTVTGVTPAYAGANSTNGGNNTNWTFTAPPSTNTGAFFAMF